MNVSEALELLKLAPNNETQCKINPIMTTADFYDIMIDSMNSQKSKYGEDHIIHDLFEKRIYQCVKNQRRPKYEKV